MFNRQARWDRSLPGGDQDSRWEPVEVVARFCGGKIIPISFTISGTQCNGLRLLYRWSERAGAARMHYFSVADSHATYCLRLDSEAMAWRIGPSG
jgi:hypothetical protein